MTATADVPDLRGVTVGINHNDGSANQPEFPEQIFRSAEPGCWPIPPISSRDLAARLVPVVVSGQRHALSGGPEKLTDGAGATGEDDPKNCFFFDNGVRNGLFRLSLPAIEPIAAINLYAWHRHALSGGIRAPLKLNVYASDGTKAGFDSANPRSPGYVLLAHVNTVRPGGVNEQSGQHGASIVGKAGQSLGRFRHFLFEVEAPVDGLSHTFFTEIDIVRAIDEGPLSPTVNAQFDNKVAPLLAKRCLDCHNAIDRKGGLDLSRSTAALAGGDSGAAYSPIRPQESLLIQRVDDDEMPPKHPLPAGEKKILRDWIAAGAAWGSDAIDRFRFTSDTRAGYDWWALRPLSQPTPPAVRNQEWPAGSIDRFILARLEKEDLAPASPADRRTLIRRLSFDLVGLPPTPEEVETFVNDAHPQAYERFVDRLLASPHYGERWARHWLDVVRFSESQGFERNKYYPSAWKYRDWVIEALNDDLPYDEFVRLQLAGDVIRPADPLANIATGYLVLTPHDLLGLTQGSAGMKANTREDELENLVGNIGQTFLGLTINCARCHDHKFDPLHQAEYYQLAAAVGGLKRSERELPTIETPPADREPIEQRLAETLGSNGAELVKSAMQNARDQARKEVEQAKTAVAEAEKKASPADGNSQQVLTDRKRELLAVQDLAKYAESPHSTLGFDGLLSSIPSDRRAACAPHLVELSQLDMHDRLAAGGTGHGFSSRPTQFFHVMSRGNFREPGAVVTPRGFSCIASLPADWGLAPNAPESQRRLHLAQWITDPHNPLFARVIVNRLWHHHFGVGLVDTPNDFGYSGGRPSHPELLDWLAGELIASGWRLKTIHRDIVLSSTYRQACTLATNAAKADAGNRLLWRKTPQRLEAEAVRDAVLAVSGELNYLLGGPSFHDIKVGVSADNTDYTPMEGFGPQVNRRTIYRTVVRTTTPSLLETLDCADPTVATPRRAVTTTPLQALALLNNNFMVRAAAAFADRVKREVGNDTQRQADRAYLLAYGRPATDLERQRAVMFIREHGLADLCLLVFNSNEFLYVD